MGNFHCDRSAGAEERLESIRLERLRADPDRHAAQSVVRRAEVHHAAAPAEPPEPGADDPRRRRQRRLPRRLGRAAGETVVVSHRLHCQPERSAIQESDHEPTTDRRPCARRGVRASAVGRVLPQGRLCGVDRADRAQPAIPSRLSGAGSKTASGPTGRADSRMAPCRRCSSRGDTANPSRSGSTRICRSTAPTTTVSASTRPSFHFHNAHNGAESDGAANCHHFPGTFYDYRWSTTLARRDKINTGATDRRASGPDGNGGLINVAGDFREIQGTMWWHDHRFFFTAENVYKGNFGMVNYYSGPDRGNESLNDGVNLRLPSGSLLDSGNIDFNLIVSDAATDQAGQLFFDIFNTDGFLGDIPLVNMAYAPNMNVLPRKYRFRILNACMSRFWKLALAGPTGTAVPFQFIANDGNFVVNPITLTTLDRQGTAERYDIVVDFSRFRIGDKIKLVNQVQMRDDGRGPKQDLTLAQALAGDPNDPCIGAIMQFRVAASVPSVDVPGVTLFATSPDPSVVPNVLTEQIPIVTPVRTRLVEWGRAGNGDSRNPVTGQCTPDCPETATFPWTVRINGQAAHSMNANRISLLVPKAGEIEHWTYVNGGGGWDHPIHLHFEEGVTINRGTDPIPATERLVRKDVWRLRSTGQRQVTFQIQFGEYGGSYVNHCHNTVHEDFALLMRIQLLTGVAGSPQTAVTPTPNPTPDGIVWTTPEILPEGDPRTPV